MNERFPDATAEDLIDATCIICREDMTSAKKLPCGHCFHFYCLRSWLEWQQTCPTCREPILVEPANGNRPARRGAAGANAEAVVNNVNAPVAGNQGVAPPQGAVNNVHGAGMGGNHHQHPQPRDDNISNVPLPTPATSRPSSNSRTNANIMETPGPATVNTTSGGQSAPVSMLQQSMYNLSSGTIGPFGIYSTNAGQHMVPISALVDPSIVKAQMNVLRQQLELYELMLAHCNTPSKIAASMPVSNAGNGGSVSNANSHTVSSEPPPTQQDNSSQSHNVATLDNSFITHEVVQGSTINQSNVNSEGGSSSTSDAEEKENLVDNHPNDLTNTEVETATGEPNNELRLRRIAYLERLKKGNEDG